MRALVTRPREDAERLAAALRARGIEPVLAPLLAIRPLPEAKERLASLVPGAQAVLFTSANGVRAFAAAAARRDLPAFAVGDATAAAARAEGFAAVENAHGDVEDLARLVQARLKPEAGALIHAAASAVAGDLAGALGAAGFELRRAVLYEAVPASEIAPEIKELLRWGGVEIALFFSPRTAATFVRLAAAGLAEACQGMIAVALSPAVAAALEPLAWKEIRVARAPNEAALLAIMEGREASA